jgi:hypothetical protein
MNNGVTHTETKTQQAIKPSHEQNRHPLSASVIRAESAYRKM